MILDLSDEETRALLNLLVETVEADRRPFSPRIRVLRDILAKFGAMGPKPPRGSPDAFRNAVSAPEGRFGSAGRAAPGHRSRSI